MSPEVRLALVTGPDADTMKALSRTLVEERLIACANLVDPVTSIYRWQGGIEEDAEVLAILKTTTDRLAVLEERVLELHPYDTPEFIVLGVEAGASSYLDWVRDSTRMG